MFILTGSASAYAAEQEPAAEAIILDVILVRPLGIVSIVFGTGMFFVALPFTIPSGTVKVSAEKLVQEPFIYTFIRPVGEIKGFNQ